MITDTIRKATDPIRIATNDARLYPWLIWRPVRECVTWALSYSHPKPLFSKCQKAIALLKLI